MNRLVSVITRVSKTIPKRNFFTIIPQYQKGVKSNLGKFRAVVDPGLRLYLPIYHHIEYVDMRETMQEIPKQSLISKDNVTFYFNGSIQYKIVDPKKAIFNVDDLRHNIVEKAQMEMRNILSTRDINEILQEKNKISDELISSFKESVEDWGVDIKSIQIKDFQFDENMKRSMSVRAEADRNAEAKIINARADVETAKQYAEAAKIYAENPITMRLREYQLWQQVSKNPASSIYVVPSNLVEFFKPDKK
jgi:erythrocyte band 7 integral membrane protein